MAWGLPKLPGLTFSDPTKTQHHLKSSLYYYQGYRIPDPKVVGPGSSPTDLDSNAFALPEDTVIYDPSLTYGRVKQQAMPAVIPLWVHYDKRCLNFQAFMKQPVYDSPLEKYRLRYVNIVYFLEDDTITVMEKPIRNSGIWQGRMVKRDKIPKNDLGEFWHWKDLDVGKDICIYGKVFHTVSCDLFTKEWLESNGIELSGEEEMPSDAFTEHERWKSVPPPQRVKAKTDPLRRFLEYDGKVLVFNCVWDNRDAEHGELDEYKMLYFLQDDTVSVKELHDEKGGKDPFPLLLKKTKLPKKWKDVPVNFPSSVLELSEEEVTEYYAPRDLMIGATIFVLGRRFLLYDCDNFTRLYYKSMLGIDQPPPIKLQKKEEKEFKKSLPPHIGIGAPEDTIQSCYGLVPKPPHKDVVKYNLNANKYLRYLCELDWIHPEDRGRQFILSYALFNGTIKIKEVPRRNSGIWEGKFLNAMRLPLPTSDPNFPTYYTPDKFYVGAIIPVFKFRFKIVGCDLFVYRYMSANPDKFPQEVIDNVRNYHMSEGNLKDELEEAIRDEATNHQRTELGAVGKAPVAMVDPLQECLTEMKVVEGQAEYARPPTPPLTTDVVPYDESLGLVRMSKPPCEGITPLKGILKSGAPRDDHQKVVCFSGPAADEHRQDKPKHVYYPPGQQPHYTDEEDFCDRYKAPDAEERKERRAKDICAYEVTPQPPAAGAAETVTRPKGPGFLGSYGVDCKENPEFMRLPPDAYEKARALRRDVPEISPAATREAEYPREPFPPVKDCAQPPPAEGGPCAPFKPEDVAFSCPHTQLRKPCCDPYERDHPTKE